LVPWTTLERFDEDHGDIKSVRDIIEHFDEYIAGSGHLQRSNRVNEPFRIRFESESGHLYLALSRDQRFDIDLRNLQRDIGYMVIDLTVDLDALEDEPQLFADDLDVPNDR